MEMHSPAHVGEIIRHEILAPLNIRVTDAAKVLGVTRPTLSRLLNEKASLSPEMSLRIEKAFGAKADHLMRMQLSYDMAQIRQRAQDIQVEPYVAAKG